MSNVGPEGRSSAPITHDDLLRLAEIARRDRERFFTAHPLWAALYGQRLLCVALCQGAALHYLNGTTGIQDFDVWTFYRRHPAKDWYPRRNVPYDFGDAKFGRSLPVPRYTKKCLNYIGRRVDCIGRSIEAEAGEDPVVAVQRYLREGRADSARLLAQKAVILLEPECGQVIWPVGGLATTLKSAA